MTRDPIRRRFGKGAARLRVGIPSGAEPLSSVARTPIRLERRLTVVPLVTAAAIAWLLVTSANDDSILAPHASQPIQVVLEAWPEPRVLEPVQPLPQESSPKARAPEVRSLRTTRASRDVLAARPAPTASEAGPAPDSTPDRAPSESSRRFDPAALATRGAHWSVAEMNAAASESAELIRDAAERGAAPATTARRLRRTDPARPAPAAVAQATQSARGATIPTRFGARSGTAAATPLSIRPGSEPGAGGSAPSDALVAAATAGRRSRQAALAALDRSAAEAGAGGAEPSTRRPEVSAARDVAPLLAGTSSGTALDGWQEVPLDELPDCSPPGRQDLLKKRILLAASVRAECSSGSGSFRFVEARSLGAFLMWSRPNPDRRAGQPRDRDACDVLSRALACLGDPSSQESKSR